MPSPRRADAADAVVESFREVVARTVSRGAPPPPRSLVLAVSGGLDSVTLLDLFDRSREELGLRLHVAHFDHAMRPDSAADAEWVAGVCEARGISVTTRRAEEPPASEADARSARWAFLHALSEDRSAWRIVTAHHADDQAETVLFRIVRGTGLDGLAAMSTDDGRVLRPLLGVSREALEAYARARSLEWREDPSNEDLSPARNRLRHQIIPLLEAHVAPGTRASLVRLSEHARHRAGAAADPGAVVRVVEPAAVLVARHELVGYDPPARLEIARRALRAFGVVPSAAGTRSLVEFITDAASGRTLHLPGGLRAHAELGMVRIERRPSKVPDVPFRFVPPADDRSRISGLTRIGGRTWRVEVAQGRPSDRDGGIAVGTDVASPPYTVRAWRDGDRIATAAGSKKLKEVFRERRVPARERGSIPVLTDADDRVLWAHAAPASVDLGDPSEIGFTVWIDDD